MSWRCKKGVPNVLLMAPERATVLWVKHGAKSVGSAAPHQCTGQGEMPLRCECQWCEYTQVSCSCSYGCLGACPGCMVLGWPRSEGPDLLLLNKTWVQGWQPAAECAWTAPELEGGGARPVSRGWQMTSPAPAHARTLPRLRRRPHCHHCRCRTRYHRSPSGGGARRPLGPAARRMVPCPARHHPQPLGRCPTRPAATQQSRRAQQRRSLRNPRLPSLPCRRCHPRRAGRPRCGTRRRRRRGPTAAQTPVATTSQGPGPRQRGQTPRPCRRACRRRPEGR
eukprot:359359-Chlamydomonas_euryale.AAC.4